MFAHQSPSLCLTSYCVSLSLPPFLPPFLPSSLSSSLPPPLPRSLPPSLSGNTAEAKGGFGDDDGGGAGGAGRDGGGYLSAGRSGGSSAEETRSGHKAVAGGIDEVDGRANTLFSKLSTHAFIVMFDINSMPSYRHAQVITVQAVQAFLSLFSSAVTITAITLLHLCYTPLCIPYIPYITLYTHKSHYPSKSINRILSGESAVRMFLRLRGGWGGW